MAVNTSRVIELALVFFVTLLSFSIGTYVGKKYSDNQHKLAQLEPKNNKHEADQGHMVEEGDSHTTAAAGHETKKEGEGMSDADVAKLAEEFTQEEDTTHEPAKNIAEVEDKAAKTTATQAALQKIKAAKPAATHEESQNLPREVASISDKAKSIGSQQFTVQVGAYTNTTDAEKMTDTLKARGYKAGYVSAEVNGKTYYRVQVGLFENLQQAQEFKKDLMEKNQLSSAIIQKVTH